jgi:hypothetical protein
MSDLGYDGSFDVLTDLFSVIVIRMDLFGVLPVSLLSSERGFEVNVLASACWGCF